MFDLTKFRECQIGDKIEVGEPGQRKIVTIEEIYINTAGEFLFELEEGINEFIKENDLEGLRARIIGK